MTRIVLLQNDLLVGAHLHRALEREAGLQVVGLAGSLAQARALLDRSGAELLLADLRIGDERVVELLHERRAHARHGLPQVLVIAMSADDPQLMLALRHGADGYFVHGDPIGALTRVIRQVLAGESPMSTTIAREMQAHFSLAEVASGGPAHPLPRPLALTHSEQQMLNRASQGYLPHEIAREMQTSEHSLGLRTRSLYRKLQLDLRSAEMERRAA